VHYAKTNSLSDKALASLIGILFRNKDVNLKIHKITAIDHTTSNYNGIYLSNTSAGIGLFPLVRVLNCVPVVDDLGNICGVIRIDL
jgi:hypothetical protein